MLGLLRNHSGTGKGHHGNGQHSTPKPGKYTPEPAAIAEKPITSPADVDMASPTSPGSLGQSGFFSMPSIIGGARGNKRYSSLNTKRSILGRSTTTTTTTQSASAHAVKEQYISVRQRAHRELGARVDMSVFDTSHAGLLDWIRTERMARLPQKGGYWDRVLISAHYFAAQVNHLADAIESFTPECSAASNLLYGQCLLLLQLGHENARALQTAFDLFYQLGLELSPLLRAVHALQAAPSIMDHVSRAFSELLNIVSGIAIGYFAAVHGTRHSTATLDIYATFGASIDSYRSRVQKCTLDIWNFELQSHGYDETAQIETLQQWLAPQDKVLAYLSSNHISLATRPEEYTCVWFQSYLNSFFKHDEKVLFVEGRSGSGKTALADWAVNRLQRPVGGRSISTLSFFYNSSIPAQTSCLSMLKTLLFQLLSLRIGDIHLFDVIYTSFAESKILRSAKEQESMLWETLRHALYAVSGDEDNLLAIVVDGLDEMEGLKPAAKQVSAKLRDIVEGAAGLRVLLFSQSLGSDPAHPIETVDLSTETVYDDIHAILQQGLSHVSHFADKSFAEQEDMVDGLLDNTSGSMLMATLFIEYLKQHKSRDEFEKGVEILLNTQTHSVSELVQKLLTIAKLDDDSKKVLSFLIAARRPLSFNEVALLLEAEPKSKKEHHHLSHLTKSISPFVITVEGLIMIRHDAVKQALLNIPETSNLSLHLKDRHKDLLIRLLLCTGKHLARDNDEPRLDLLTSSDIEKQVASNQLLEYTVRYWVIHFKLSSLFKSQGDLPLSSEFTSIFPSSVTFALLEASRWRTQYLPDEAAELFTIAFRVRKQLFGLERTSVLQSAITCAIFYETVLGRYSEAAEWYIHVIRIGQKVLSVQDELVITCCTTLLHISETLVTKTRTEIMTYREETMLTLITAYTHQYGASSKEVLKIYESLAELYVFISEESKAIEIRTKITEIHAGFHKHEFITDADVMSRQLDVMLKKSSGVEEVEGFGSLLLGYEAESEEEWTIVHVESLIHLAIEFVKRGFFAKAEDVYVELMLKLAEICISTQVCEWHEKRIEVMIKYASFLHTQRRLEEASTVLICCWTDYSLHQVSMFESIVLLFKEVAVCMRLVGMTSMSLTVFQRCWSWFKSTHKEESSVFKEIVELIAVTSSEVVKKSTTTTTTTTTTTSSSETVIREVFESSLSSEETEVTTTTVELCNSLTSIYIKESRWSEAMTVIKSTLKKTWSSFFSETIESNMLSSSLAKESIKLVLDLAECYIAQKRYEKVDYLYLRLYRIHCKSLKFDDATVIKYRETYINFLKKFEMHSTLISFYQELLVEYRSFFGAADLKTIELLYALGDICRSHSLTHGYWIEYYSEIIVSLNKGGVICNEHALRAITIMAEYYYDTQRYSESLVYLKSIITTFCKFGTKYKYFQDETFMTKTLERYYRVIEETQIEIHEHITILKEIRAACSKYFSESSTISLTVTETLAEVCSKSEKYQYEAISYYEHIMKHSKTVSTSTVKRSQSILRSLYVKQITSSSSSSTTTVTKETIEKATSMTHERYLEIKKSHSCTHESTITVLKELVQLYQRQEKIEIAIKELRSHAIECVTSVSSAKQLIEAAQSVASIFISLSQVSVALQFVRELKHQVIYKIVSKTAGFDIRKVGRSCFGYIASLEFHLRTTSGGTIAGYMAEILAEFLFYERLVTSIQQKARIAVVVLHGARLRDILYRGGRSDDFDIVENQVVEYFMAHETSVVKAATKASIRGFVRILLSHFSQHKQPKDFVASASRAAVTELRQYLANEKYQNALELTQCTFKFLMAHEGLDDPTEITLGFQLALMMAGRGEFKRASGSISEETNKTMLGLSRTILAEVFDICTKNMIALYRCPLPELNELVSLVGDQKDTPRLLLILESLWNSRDGQSSWPKDVKLKLGTRLVQARFMAGDMAQAARLAEDIVYNLRRINGPRHQQTLSMYELLASIYTSAGHHYAAKSTAESASAADKRRDASQAKSFFKKAVTTNEDLLKLLVDTDADDSDDDDDDLFSVTSSHYGSARGGRKSAGGHHGSLGRRTASQLTFPAGQAPSAGTPNGHDDDDDNTEIGLKPGYSTRQLEAPREVLVAVARKHLRLAKLAVQRFGGWSALSGRRFNVLTTKIWQEFRTELKLSEEQVLSAKWKVTGFALGQAEGGLEEDGFTAPKAWAFC
ncbi:hypothetical protein F5Y16DRAFT_389291 [Xylariaceae sp. FL0255]|nr:hypothetical protein F5Y16DRAFT_389291 [Xylariaceae sp. FL0255]